MTASTQNLLFRNINDIVKVNKLIQQVDQQDNLRMFNFLSCDTQSHAVVKICRGVVLSNSRVVARSFPWSPEYAVDDTENINKVFLTSLPAPLILTRTDALSSSEGDYNTPNKNSGVVECILKSSQCSENTSHEIINNKDISLSDCIVYDSYEGAIIRVFYNQGKWYTSTHRRLDATKSKWSSSESFGFTFKKAISHNYKNNPNFANKVSIMIKNQFSSSLLKTNKHTYPSSKTNKKFTVSSNGWTTIYRNTKASNTTPKDVSVNNNLEYDQSNNDDKKLKNQPFTNSYIPEVVNRFEGLMNENGNIRSSNNSPVSSSDLDASNENDKTISPVSNNSVNHENGIDISPPISCVVSISQEDCENDSKLSSEQNVEIISSIQDLVPPCTMSTLPQNCGDKEEEVLNNTEQISSYKKNNNDNQCANSSLLVNSNNNGENDDADDDGIYNLFLNSLNKRKCYLFVVSNNNYNRIVCDAPEYPTVHHIGTYIESNKLELNEDIGLPKPKLRKFETLTSLCDYVKQIDYRKKQGVIVYDNNSFPLCKIVNSMYKMLSDIRGNQPSIKFRYLQLRNEPEKVELLKKLYPQHSDDFDQYEKLLYSAAKDIYYAYVKRYIRNEHVILPQAEYRVLRDCHNWYIENRLDNKITMDIVMDIINHQRPSTLNKIIYNLLNDLKND